MQKIQIQVDLQDKEYAGRLVEFLNTHYSERVKAGVEERAEGGHIDRGLLVTDRHRADAPYTRTVLLSEEGISPFQSIHVIMEQIFAWQDANLLQERVVELKGKKGKWISVYGYSGGSGTSTLALCLAHALKSRGEVLFLPLSGAESKECFENVSSYTIADLLYCFLLSGEKDWKKMVGSMVRPQGDGLFYIQGTSTVDDLQELTEGEVEKWMQSLCENFDYVVADLGTLVCRSQRNIVEKGDAECRLLYEENRAEKLKREQVKLLKSEDRPTITFARGGLLEKEECYVSWPEDEQVYWFDSGKRKLNLNSACIKTVKKAVEECEWTKI